MMFSKSLITALTNVWPMLTIFIVVLITIRLFYMKGNRRDFVLYKEILTLIFIVYLLLLFELVTNTETSGGGINLVPFTEIFRYELGSKLFFYNVIGNIVVFIPFGFFVAAYIKNLKVGSIIFITLITSLTIELVQLKIGRALDIDDIILNVVGGLLGFLLYVGLDAIKKRLPGIFQKDSFYNILTIILLALIIFYGFQIMGIRF